MSVKTVTKELARLSYSDMKILSKEISARLCDGNTQMAEQIADVLASLGADLTSSPNPDEAKANTLLRQALRKTRSKRFAIELMPDGYEVSCRGIRAVAQRLPDAVNQLVDQLVALEAMGVTK